MNASRPRRPRRRAVWAALALATAFVAPGAHAQDALIHGRLEIQDAGDLYRGDSLNAALGDRADNDAQLNLRLTWAPSWGPWRLEVHTVLAGETGPPVRVARTESALLPAPPPTLFDLTGALITERQTSATASIDRLSLAYATPDLVVRVGRQALSWGSGLVFRPMDLFDPFSPAATDTEYKSGVDMVYVQRLFGDGSDLQFIVAPRAPRFGEAPPADSSSVALHLQTSLLGHHTTWLLARDHGDWVGALGINGALGGATWNLEAIPTGLRQGGTRLSALANISDARTLFGRNATVFGEYFHNGFGVAGGDVSVSALPADLTDRIARGQVFDIRRNYVGAGFTVEANPLLTLGPTLIVNIDDGSLYLLAQASLSLADNLTLTAGGQAPIGPTRSEFGGLPLTPTEPTLLAPPARVYLQLRRYF